MSDKLYVVLPAYNEEANIEAVVQTWYKILRGKDDTSRIVVADSHSTDKTHEILVKMQSHFPQLEVMSDTGQYHGQKVIALYDYAIRRGADYVFQTDADGQTNPDEFDAFWNLRNQYDGIFGERRSRGDGKTRAFVEKVVCLLLKMYFHVSVPDANAPFRLIKTATLKKYLYKMDKDYNLPNIMITAYFARYNERMIFMPISFKARQGGVNSVNIPRIVKIGWKALRDFNKFKKEMNADESKNAR